MLLNPDEVHVELSLKCTCTIYHITSLFIHSLKLFYPEVTRFVSHDYKDWFTTFLFVNTPSFAQLVLRQS